MKVAPLLHALDGRPQWDTLLVHTGQHYDAVMSEAFFRDLEIRAPDVNLGVGSGSHATQVAGVLTGMEPVLRDEAPDIVVVVGDVNSTLAAALAAVKLLVPVAHVEAGLRSGDRTMPEEINRILTDQMASICLTPSREASDNLVREGIAPDRIHFVGNIMIDSLRFARSRCDSGAVLRKHALESGAYGLVTLHRPSNVDDADTLNGIMHALDRIAHDRPLIFPAHPRTRRRLEALSWSSPAVRVVEPLPYLEMVSLLEHSAVVFTDSGGLQEESTALGVPCFTLRSTTERPITISEGTNVLVPDRRTDSILEAYRARPSIERTGRVPDGWDGRAAVRIVRVLADWSQGDRAL